MGWLASTIESETKTRAQRYFDANAPLPLVEIEAGEYLLDTMKELGPIRSNGFGLTIPDWSEITAFAAANGSHFEPWEFRTLRKLCKAYLRGINEGKEPLSIPPMDRASENA